ncbi:UMP kinase [Inmirania thermothiophila]|uniref:Uridylate kinase n=1 Tax=Inmirania thermothiophila TaxID=1750597 RepID=A0A3N1Y062_9GAMM|nr:UMP kinase [Inmirania thermothiophila]ROR32216.1 uridylate kinase [Inmirania thermothiophila]
MAGSEPGGPAPRRVLLKLSGEALAGGGGVGIDPAELSRLAGEIAAVARLGAQVGVVVGGGNLLRGAGLEAAGLAAAGVDRVTGDHMGMLATVMNALAMRAALRRHGVEGRVLSALQVEHLTEPASPDRALRHLAKGRVVFFAAGTGNPFFTTDSAAALRAIEISAGLLLKATKVDGVYSDDPVRNPQARRYERLGFDEALERRLGVMDLTAMELCRQHGMPVRVFDVTVPGNLERVMRGEPLGTLVE